jgi:hypothetical protein
MRKILSILITSIMVMSVVGSVSATSYYYPCHLEVGKKYVSSEHLDAEQKARSYEAIKNHDDAWNRGDLRYWIGFVNEWPWFM